ncbi:hypothetical protein [Zavarzinella formosa]|uniref:hypothetical protein n=1 Tax=Zavarzinella formosa TaxID=360055 RepID=UPI0002E65749|nr:hypothetical protein [Zavarzinella formosa]
MKAETFGSFPAAQILVSRLEKLNNPLVTKKVSRFLQDYNEGLKHLNAIKHAGYRKRCVLLWRDDFLKRLAIDPFVDKFVSNLICTYGKDASPPDVV